MTNVEMVHCYNLTQHELDLEIGRGISEDEVKRQADLISKNWKTPETLPSHPTLLMLGGFQGSGKTTVVESLQADLGLIVISPDEIRHNLFTQNYPFSEEFVKIVSATKFELIKRALQTGAHAAIDQSTTPDRVKLTKKTVESFPSYTMLTVFLSAPKDVLKKRVEERKALPGKYKGTVDELEASIKRYIDRYGEPNPTDYDLMIDVDKNTPDAVSKLLAERLTEE